MEKQLMLSQFVSREWRYQIRQVTCWPANLSTFYINRSWRADVPITDDWDWGEVSIWKSKGCKEDAETVCIQSDVFQSRTVLGKNANFSVIVCLVRFNFLTNFYCFLKLNFDDDSIELWWMLTSWFTILYNIRPLYTVWVSFFCLPICYRFQRHWSTELRRPK